MLKGLQISTKWRTSFQNSGNKMLIVPVKNDDIATNDGGKYTVVKYSYNSKSDTVVCIARDSVSKDTSIVNFSDIAEIQGVKVELIGDGIFKSYGNVMRKYHLPQKKDVVAIGDKDIVVSAVKLVEGQLVVADEYESYPLSSITNIVYSDHNRFTRLSFNVYYRDYIKK